MIRLQGTIAVLPAAPLVRTMWLLVDGSQSPSPEYAFVVGQGPIPVGFGLYLRRSDSSGPITDPAITATLPAELDHLGPGDIIDLSPDGRRVRVLWRREARPNSVLLTERCDNLCLMCSQPPREGDDSWLLARATELVRMLPIDTREIIYTGGEPTIYGTGFIDLIRLTLDRLPEAEVHILSNGRRFSDEQFARDYAQVGNSRLMVGVPLYGAQASLHDFVVQSTGAFDETVRGILNLVALDQGVEIRVVIHKQTAPALVEIAEFIARNLPFVDQVALMGLEVMGLARANLGDVWIDPWDYRAELAEAASLLEAARIRTLIFNHPLCVTDETVWHLAVPSISDWKNVYLPECERCSVRDRCGGLFHSSAYKRSDHLHPIEPADSVKPAPHSDPSRAAGTPVNLRDRQVEREPTPMPMPMRRGDTGRSLSP